MEFFGFRDESISSLLPTPHANEEILYIALKIDGPPHPKPPSAIAIDVWRHSTCRLDRR